MKDISEDAGEKDISQIKYSVEQSEKKIVLRIFSIIVVLILLTSTIILALQQKDILSELSPQAPKPVLVTATKHIQDFGSTVRISAEKQQRVEILSTSQGQKVTQIIINVGDEVKHGDVLFKQNGIAVIGYQSDAVFYRPLRQGDTGADVTQLQKLLKDLFDVKITDKNGSFGYSTFQATRKLSEKVGAGKNNGIFDPSWLVRIPTKKFVIDELFLTLGKAAPQADSPILLSAPEINVFEIFDAPEGPDGEYEFRYQGESFNFTKENGQWDVEDTQKLNRVFQLNGGSETSTEIQGYMASADVHEAIGIPNAAVVVTDQGETCVYTLDSDDKYIPQGITTEGSTNSGIVLVSGNILEGDQILLNPHEMFEDLSC